MINLRQWFKKPRNRNESSGLNYLERQGKDAIITCLMIPNLDLNFCRSLKDLFSTLIDLRENRDVSNIDINKVGVSDAGAATLLFFHAK